MAPLGPVPVACGALLGLARLDIRGRYRRSVISVNMSLLGREGLLLVPLLPLLVLLTVKRWHVNRTISRKVLYLYNFKRFSEVRFSKRTERDTWCEHSVLYLISSEEFVANFVANNFSSKPPNEVSCDNYGSSGTASAMQRFYDSCVKE